MLRHLAAAAVLMLSLPGAGRALDTSTGGVAVVAVADGLTEPWGFAFLPGGDVLVTERDGRLLRIGAAGDRSEIAGLPEVFASGQGGLLDIAVLRDFAQTREIAFTFARPQGWRGAGTALAIARLAEDGTRLEDLRVIFEAEPGWSGGRHFGSRVVEAPDGTLFVTTGDRGDRPSAQDTSNHNGSVIRVARDGSVPGDNPFVGQAGIQPEIWSYGHRNPQGAALDLTGQLWVNEHGARGGDEVNRVERGANYGWPVIAYGRHYTGGRIGEGTEKPGLEQPVHYWDPSIAPSGMTFYDGDLFPTWRGNAFVGSLKFDYIARLSGDPLREVEQIKGDETWRVRDVKTGPDGALWFLSVGNGALYRMTPE